MIEKYRKIDTLVVEGIGKSRGKIADWATMLPPDVADKILDIVHSPVFADSEVIASEQSPSRWNIGAWVICFGVLMFSGATIASVWAGTATYFTVGVVVALIALFVVAMRQRKRTTSWAAALGIGHAPVENNNAPTIFGGRLRSFCFSECLSCSVRL